MNAVTGMATWPPPRNGGEHATRESLDALASNRCTPDEFLREILERFQNERNGKWEVLALLDQYYRRGKISQDVFQQVKLRLGESALGSGSELEPEAQPRTSPAVTLPAATPQQSAAAKLKLAPRPLAQEIASGDLLRGRYRIQEVLGQGRTGTVFAALDEYRLEVPETGQRLAVKVLHAAVSMRVDLLTQVQREFQHLQLLSHPNVIRVHEFDRDGETAFFTMEALSGLLLGRILDARQKIALPRPLALAIIRDAGAALAHAHSRGVIHGDLSPQNIFLTHDGELRVLDFGASHKAPHDALRNAGEPAGSLISTPGYASFELLQGHHATARDDVFAFACIVFVLLSGSHPFPNRTAMETAARRRKPKRPGRLTDRQWRVLQEGLQWDREKRSPSVPVWLQRFDLSAAAPRLPPLRDLLRTPPPRQRRWLLWGGAMVTAAVIAALAYGAWSNQDWSVPTVAAVNSQAQSLLKEASEFIRRELGSNSAASAPASPRSDATASLARPAAALDATASGGDPKTAAATPAAVLESSQAIARTAATARPGEAEAAPPITTLRVEMTADTVDVPQSEKIARVTVRRRGSMRGETEFSWWTESGTAKPGLDFSPVTPRVEHLENGISGATLSVPVLDRPRNGPVSFYVVIDKTEAGAALGTRTLTMVTLLPSE
jgi:serine/threonine protein kinase